MSEYECYNSDYQKNHCSSENNASSYINLNDCSNESKYEKFHQCGSCCPCRGPRGPQGPQGPKGDSSSLINAYSAYNLSCAISGKENFPISKIYDVGNLTLPKDAITVTLKKGYVYQVCYNIQGACDIKYNDNFTFQTLPYINGKPLYLIPASTSCLYIDQSAVGSVSSCFFVIADTDKDLTIVMGTSIETSSAYKNITFIGEMYIHTIAKLN